MPRIYTRKTIEYIINEHGCHICTSHRRDRDGYPIIAVEQKDHRMSRYIWAQKHGVIPPDAIIRHTCDERACINVQHLILGSQAENMQDMTARGRSTAGERHPNAKLSAASVMEIRRSNESHAALARKYGVGDEAIRRIRKGVSWRV